MTQTQRLLEGKWPKVVSFDHVDEYGLHYKGDDGIEKIDMNMKEEAETDYYV